VSKEVDAPIIKVWNFMVDLRKMILDPSVIDVSWQPRIKKEVCNHHLSADGRSGGNCGCVGG